MKTVDQILELIGPVRRSSLRYTFSEEPFDQGAVEASHGLTVHTLWVSELERKLAERDQQVCMLTIVHDLRNDERPADWPTIQVLAYSSHTLIKYILEQLLEALRKLEKEQTVDE